MWTMVDGQADHTLTHNRPKRSSPYSVCAPRAIRFFFFLLLKDRTAKEKRARAREGKPRRAPKMLILAAPTPYPCRLFFEWF
uniref:Uncharacterized protein n=1 Tax=Vibrio sp. VT2(2010) TaxID=795725 RepID=E9KL77_9VIBR|nr:hypothetical protein [Vibrio sp. VT2(2010)]